MAGVGVAVGDAGIGTSVVDTTTASIGVEVGVQVGVDVGVDVGV